MRFSRPRAGGTALVLLISGSVCGGAALPQGLQSTRAVDPGVRHAATDNGPPIALSALAPDELAYFQDGMARFDTVEMVSGATQAQGNGLGPRFNSNQCASCHSQPYMGGSSPALNPLLRVAGAAGASNSIPWFITANGPIREVRFLESNGVYDGGVHNLFVVSGRSDAGACNITQPTFTPAGNPLTGQGGNANLAFRIPTPILGAGLIEAIPDSAILANMTANAAKNSLVGVRGHANALLEGNVNLSANDGSITRFGWKAQNKSLLMFAGEAYNVEMGISNQLFPQERDETPSCRTYNVTPEDTNNLSAVQSGYPTAVLSDIEAFANFMRMLAPPAPATPTVSTTTGRTVFIARGLRGVPYALVHHGHGHRDGLISQPKPGAVGPTGQLILGPLGASHGARARRRNHPRFRGT